MIVVVGSLNVDLVVQVARFPKPGETLLGSDYAQHPGGKGANQAVAAARAGGRVKMVGRVGNDSFGQQLKAGLAREGIDVGEVQQLDAPSGVAFISVDASGQNCIIVAPGANARLTPEALTPEQFAGASALLVQLEVPLEAVLRAAQLARQAGAKVLLNCAPAQPLTPAQLAHIDLLITNEAEAALLLARAPEAVVADPLAAARQLAQQVPQAVITLGARGAVWAERARAGQQPAFAVQAIDTTAAGDAFVGALAVALGEGQPLPKAVRFAAAAGALATTRAGAQPSLPHRAAIEALSAGRSSTDAS